MSKHRSTGARGDPADSGTVLLITDMISTWDFPDAGALSSAARAIAPRIAHLKQRCHAAGVPVIYANDNLGRWRSDFRQLVERSLETGGVAAEITRQLVPRGSDYFVLKPKHSAFFATPLEMLLNHLHVRRLIIAGVAADQCVLVTAADARMRDQQVVIPYDCIGAETPARTRAAIRHFTVALEVPAVLSAHLRIGGVKSSRRKR
jgi:nicotinamidase-related amidase